MDTTNQQNKADLLSDNASLRNKLAEYETLLDAIRSGEVDAILRSDGEKSQLVAFEQAVNAYRQLVEKMAEGALILSTEGLILYANQYMAEMLQAPLNKLIGSSLDNWLTASGNESIQSIIKWLLKSQDNRVFHNEHILHAQSGKSIAVYIAISRGSIEDGQATFNVIVTDLTEQKRNEAIAADERLSRAILEQAADAIIVCDPGGRVIRASNSAMRLCNSNPIGSIFEQNFPLINSKGRQQTIEDFLTPGELDCSEYRLTDTHRSLHLQASATQIRSPQNEQELMGIVIVLTDVTHIKVAEQDAITAQQKLEEQLQLASRARKALLSVVEDAKESEIRLKKIASRLPGMIYQYQYYPDGTHAIPYASDAIREIFGVSPDEVKVNADKIFNKIYPEDRNGVDDSIRLSAEGLSPWRYEFRVQHNDDTIRWLFANAIPQKQSDNSIIWHGFISDITDRKSIAAKVEQAARVFDQSREGIIITDADNNIIMVNKAFTSITGYSEKDVLGKNPNLLASRREGRAFYDEMWQSIQKHGYWEGEMWNKRKDGTIYPEWLSITRTSSKSGQTAGYIGIFDDITQRKEYEKNIQWMAHYDSLTKLPNRTLLRDRMEYAINIAQRSHKKLALLFCDLDRFKNINDALGHNIGDLLLTEVANRLLSSTRREDTVSRQGGDEFIILLPDADPEGVANVAEKIQSAINLPYKLEGHEMTMSASLGIAMFPDDGEDFDTLARNADIAMYRAKHMGRKNYYFYSPELQQVTARSLRLEKDIHNAVDNQELELFYQPQVSLLDGYVSGVEALLRWNHPEFGMVSPVEFIPIAENSGEILRIGEWITRTAVQQLHDWLESGIKPIRISVNLSVRELRQPGLIDKLKNILDTVGLEADLLELEITESMLMEDQENVIITLNKINKLGIHLSIDDFGTGYSSLSYLKRLPVDQLKIDKAFVEDMLNDSDDAIIARSIISLGHSLGLNVIAEGVEQNEQLAFLVSHHCDHIQGYLFSKPMPAVEITQLLSSYEPLSLSHGSSSLLGTETLLLVDDEPGILHELERILRPEGYNILTAENGEQALDCLAMNEISVIISDQRLQGMSGVKFLRKAKEIYPDTICIILSSCTELKSITDGIYRGDIYKFIEKPWQDDLLRANICEAFTRYNISLENRRLDLELRETQKALARLSPDA